MAQLNFRAFKKKKPTDVLSFPLYRSEQEIRKNLKKEKVNLGDIFVCESVARKQAKVAGHSFDTEVRELVQHGLLHLLGYDHKNRTQKLAMGRLEQRLFYP